MSTETAAKAPRKRKASPKRRRRQTHRQTHHRPYRGMDRTNIGALIILGVIVVLGIIGTVAFDDRHWQAFDDAGAGAFERGNYDYAERMYAEALQVAQELDDDDLIRASMQALSRVRAAQGQVTENR